MSVDRFNKYVAQSTRSARPINEIVELLNEEEQTAIEQKYPKSKNAHLSTHEGDEYHVIKGTPHKHDVHSHMINTVHKALTRNFYHGKATRKVSHEEVTDANTDTPLHHTPAEKWHSKDPGKVTVHKNLEAYTRHHLNGDANYVKDVLGVHKKNAYDK